MSSTRSSNFWRDTNLASAAARIALIIPTYDEAESIVALIGQFQKVAPGLTILVADSDSRDGTARLVRTRFREKEVRVLPCGRAQGRGAAIVEAYRWLLKNSDAEAVAIADADFSHDPTDFPQLVRALDRGDVVIGSRYVRGSVIIGWPLGRRLFSGAANLLARIVLRAGIRDYTNGYRVFRRQLLETLDLSRLDADGFIMLSQELVQWCQQGRRIVEVPTRFVNRTRGRSRFRLTLVAESLWVLIKLGFALK